MPWAKVVADPSPRDLPYKMELNHRLEGGQAVQGHTIQTSKGVRIADIVWHSDERWRQIKAAGDAPAPVAPEICIEVRSRSGRTAELDEKRALYFGAGALAVWICD